MRKHDDKLLYVLSMAPAILNTGVYCCCCTEMSNIAGRPTMSTNTSDEVGGSAAETFAIGFAIGGTLLLAGVILILALQARRK